MHIFYDNHKNFSFLTIYDSHTFFYEDALVYDKDISCTILKEDLKNINDWASKWKMCFNPDPNKQATEVIYSRKSKNVDHDQLVFNNSAVTTACKQKHLGLILDEKLRFEGHMEEKISKENKGVGLQRKSRY